jgi:hypothetical protein
MDSICAGEVIGNDANFIKTGAKNLVLGGGFSTSGALDVQQGDWCFPALPTPSGS